MTQVISAEPAPYATVSRGGGVDWKTRSVIVVFFALAAVTVFAPIVALVSRSFQDELGAWTGFANFIRCIRSPRFGEAIANTLFIAACSTTAAVSLGFIYAYGLTRSRMPLRGFFRVVAMAPLYAPTMFLAIGFVYLFGNQGIITHGLFGRTSLSFDIGLYGRVGVVLVETFAAFPAVVLVLEATLSKADGRLYDAAESMGASAWRTFHAVTLPTCLAGVASAAAAAFILAVTDFGGPKIVGGRSNVLAVEIYQQVVGQQRLSMGAAASVLLLLPTVGLFALDAALRRRHTAAVTARSVPYSPRRSAWRDAALFVVCAIVALAMIVVIGTPIVVSFVKNWPYSLTPGAMDVFSLRHYDFSTFGSIGGGVRSYWTSLAMAAGVAGAGVVVSFATAYLVEKVRPLAPLRRAIHLLAVAPLGLPGLSLGLAYVFICVRPYWGLVRNPLAGLEGSMTILIACGVVHFVGVGFLTMTAALRRLDDEFEQVAASLAAPTSRLLWRVTLPACAPTLVEIAVYFFVSAMTTVSAVIFLYSPQTPLASIAIVHLDEAGRTQAAAAMGSLILLTNLMARGVGEAAVHWLRKRT